MHLAPYSVNSSMLSWIIKRSALCGFISIHFSMGQSKRRLKLDYSPLPPPCRERNRNIAEVIMNILPKMTCCLLLSFLSRCTKDMFTHQIKICISTAEIQGWALDFGHGFATCVQQIHVRVSPCHSIGLVLVVFIKNVTSLQKFFTASKQDFENLIHMHGVQIIGCWPGIALNNMCEYTPSPLITAATALIRTNSLVTMWRKGSCFFFFYWRCVLMTFHWTAYLIVLVVYPRK